MVPVAPSLIDKFSSGEEVRIAGLGDSLTYGWMVERGFFDRFVDALERRFPEAKISRQNHGIPGDTSEGGLARLDEVLAWRPQAVIVEFGLNDCFLSVPPSEVGRLQSLLARRIQEAGGTPVLCTSCPLLDAGEMKIVDPYYQAIREAAQAAKAALADLDRVWRETVPITAEYFLEDGIHPSDRGHEIMSRGLLSLFI